MNQFLLKIQFFGLSGPLFDKAHKKSHRRADCPLCKFFSGRIRHSWGYIEVCPWTIELLCKLPEEHTAVYGSTIAARNAARYVFQISKCPFHTVFVFVPQRESPHIIARRFSIASHP